MWIEPQRLQGYQNSFKTACVPGIKPDASTVIGPLVSPGEICDHELGEKLEHFRHNGGKKNCLVSKTQVNRASVSRCVITLWLNVIPEWQYYCWSKQERVTQIQIVLWEQEGSEWVAGRSVSNLMQDPSEAPSCFRNLRVILKRRLLCYDVLCRLISVRRSKITRRSAWCSSRQKSPLNILCNIVQYRRCVFIQVHCVWFFFSLIFRNVSTWFKTVWWCPLWYTVQTMWNVRAQVFT